MAAAQRVLGWVWSELRESKTYESEERDLMKLSERK